MPDEKLEEVKRKVLELLESPDVARGVCLDMSDVAKKIEVDHGVVLDAVAQLHSDGRVTVYIGIPDSP